MRKEYKDNLVLVIKPSTRLKKILIFAHGIALLAIMVNTLPLVVKVSLCVLIGIQGWVMTKRVKKFSRTLKYTESLGWQLSEGQDFMLIDILKSTVMTTKVLFLHYSYRNHDNSSSVTSKKTLLILSDALAEEDYRYLIVKLKITAIK